MTTPLPQRGRKGCLGMRLGSYMIIVSCSQALTHMRNFFVWESTFFMRLPTWLCCFCFWLCLISLQYARIKGEGDFVVWMMLMCTLINRQRGKGFSTERAHYMCFSFKSFTPTTIVLLLTSPSLVWLPNFYVTWFYRFCTLTRRQRNTRPGRYGDTLILMCVLG